MSDSNDEIDYQKIVQKLAFAAINEQRRARRWRIFFISLFFLYVTVLGFMLMDDGESD